MKNLIKKILKEGDDFNWANTGLNENKKEDDGFNWARETKLTFDENNLPRVGDVLICLPGYHSDPSQYGYENENDDPEAAGFGYAEGRIVVVGEVLTFPDNPVEKRVIIWPDVEKSELYWDDSNYSECFSCGIYGFALTYYNATLNESEEDEWEWIKDIDPAIELEPNTLYYFEPPITEEELYQLSDRISNAKWIKNWLLEDINSNMHTKIGMKYFVTRKENVNDRIKGWCNETSLEEAREMYRRSNIVNVRNEFGL